ncbi:DUF4232 domain-containing protein [Streptomyces sp. NPDC126503]|uniref:DUF4232 domain-containing protein n=1 Tax=Streptomyces sp. NPDC126503 TaxID=3155315 RepID=UPI003325DA0D
MRTHRTTTALAVAVTALSLGLTACGGDTGTGAKDAGSATGATASSSAPSATSAAPAASSSAGAGTTDTGTGTGTSGSTGGSATTADTAANTTTVATGTGGTRSTGGTGSTGAKQRACAAGDVRITAAKADEVPTEHIVLTATNTSASSCRLIGYPLIAFGEIQTAKDVPAVAKSKPAAPVVLVPGAPAYANVRIALGGAHEDNKVVTAFNVNLFAADGPAEGSVVVKAPAGGLAVNEAVAKTGYWTPELRSGVDEF